MPARRLRMPATIRQCAVLLGGSAADPPTPLLPCGDRPFLAWTLREFVRFGVEEFLLLTGPLSDRLRDSLTGIAATLPRPVSIVISEAPLPAGSGGALLHAREKLDTRFLLCNGRSLFDCNLAALLADAARDPAEMLGRTVLCRPAPGAPAAVNAGVTVLDRRVLDHVAPGCSLRRDVLPGLCHTEAAGYFVDIGIPGELARAQRDLPARLHRPALLLDRDGVLNLDHGYVATRERFDWMPGAIAAVRHAVTRGWHVFVVTNQSGVARGLYDEAAVQELMRWVANALRSAGGTLDDWRYCPTHPEAAVPAYRRASDWRKPGPGMLLDLIRAWELDPGQAIMVGDTESDMQAAAAAGVRGVRFQGGDLAAVTDPLLAEPRSAPLTVSRQACS